MSTRFTAGEFEIENFGGYPFWCAIKKKGKEVVRMHHNELRDLEYIANRMRNALRGKLAKLGQDGHEVD